MKIRKVLLLALVLICSTLLLKAATSIYTATQIDANVFPSNGRLKEAVSSEGYETTVVNRDSDGVVTTATVVWMDGTSGTFTTTSKNTNFLTIDAFTITHTASGKTITQSTVTRNASGAITLKPTLTVTP